MTALRGVRGGRIEGEGKRTHGHEQQVVTAGGRGISGNGK